MTSSVGQPALDLGDPAARPRVRAWDVGRLIARVGRALWMRDRAVAEARWAAITLTTMAILAVVAEAIDPEDTQFHLALQFTPAAALIAASLGWTGAGNRLVQRRVVRLLLGPAVLIVAAAACGGIDVKTLAMPSAGPLLILALTYAAITASYPIAAFMLLTGSTLVGVGHAVIATQDLVGGDLVSDEYVVRIAVALLASTGLAVVVRIASTAEERAVRLAARSRRRLDDFETLERIVRRFDGTHSVREVIQGVVDDVSREFEIALVSIYLPQGERQLTMVGVAGYHTPFHVIDVGVGVIGRAATTLETQFVPDVLADPDYRAARDDVRNEVAAPIVHDGELLGVINFEGTLRKPLGTTHIALAEMLGRTIATSLRSARIDEERQQRLHAIERVLAVSRGLLSDLDRRRTVAAVVDAAADLLSAERVLVAGRGHDGRLRVEGDSDDPHDGSWRSRWLDDSDVAALEAVDTGEAVLRVADGRAVLAVPIRVGDEVAAVLIASRGVDAPSFTETDRSIGELLATQVGVALHNADRHATVSDAAARDPLTGLLNRRSFDELVEAAFASARRTATPLSLIVLDLDRFSAVNNDHGHAVGDAVLRRVAHALRDHVRVGDTVVRYGGEEFVVVAPGADSAEAVAVAERVRTAIGTLDPEVGGVPVPITVSAGVASLLGDELDGQALFRAADSALLAAKRGGRDRVVAV